MGNADDPEERRFARLWLMLVLLPVIYLAALGPMHGLASRGLIPVALVNMMGVAYRPLGWISEETDFFERPPGSAYISYLALFEP